MPSVPDSTEYIFTGNVAFESLTSSEEASEYVFTGDVAYSTLTSVPDSFEYIFIGNASFVHQSEALATEYIFNHAMTAPGPATGTGIVMFPISEDASVRPPTRY